MEPKTQNRQRMERRETRDSFAAILKEHFATPPPRAVRKFITGCRKYKSRFGVTRNETSTQPFGFDANSTELVGSHRARKKSQPMLEDQTRDGSGHGRHRHRERSERSDIEQAIYQSRLSDVNKVCYNGYRIKDCQKILVYSRKTDEQVSISNVTSECSTCHEKSERRYSRKQLVNFSKKRMSEVAIGNELSFSHSVDNTLSDSNVLKTTRSMEDSSAVEDAADVGPEHFPEYAAALNRKIDWSDVELPTKTDLLLHVYNMYCDFVFTDFTVYIGDLSFRCHLRVLQTYADYFRYVREPFALIPASKVSPDIFCIIYQWMLDQTGNYAKFFTRANVLDHLTAAKYLRIPELLIICTVLMEDFEEDLALTLFLDAGRRNVECAMAASLPKVRLFFLPLVATPDFLDLELQTVRSILSSDGIRVHCEMEVFMAAVRWLVARWAERKQHVLQLMECVRFSWCSPFELADLKNNPANPHFRAATESLEVSQMVWEGMAVSVARDRFDEDTSGFREWMRNAGMSEPASRDWLPNQRYESYSQFLGYLEGLSAWPDSAGQLMQEFE